jgi:hypothetical protein
MATVIDDVVAAQLNTSSAIAARRMSDDSDAAATRQRDSFSQNMQVVNAAIALKLLESTDPETDSDFNASVRTPYAVGPAGELVPSNAVVQK